MTGRPGGARVVICGLRIVIFASFTKVALNCGNCNYHIKEVAPFKKHIVTGDTAAIILDGVKIVQI
jgi:hypothetical protein